MARLDHLVLEHGTTRLATFVSVECLGLEDFLEKADVEVGEDS